MRVLITGGTGSLGRALLAARPAPADIVIRVQSRRAAPSPAAVAGGLEWAVADLATGEGVPAAVAGADVIVHAASDSRRSEAVDVQGTRRLVEAAAAAGVRHLVYVSIVGIDQIPLRYYRHKLAAERIVLAGAVPWSVLRATQFHSLIDFRLAKAARAPLVMPLPTRLRHQSVATAEVARRLWRSVDEGPRGRLRDFAGPEIMTVREAATAWMEARGVRKPILPLPLPGAVAAAFRAGKATAPDGDRGTITWREWLLNA